MRELKSGEIVIRVRASNLALLFYNQEFGGDIVDATSQIYGKYIKLIQSVTGQEDLSKVNLKELKEEVSTKKIDISQMKLPGMDLLKVVWAMHKAQNKAENLPTPKFEDWLVMYDNLKVHDIQLAALEEAADGFFR